jgi:peptidoglycan/xylan/chitin deacetylase (PgdA/CDA1 family)
VAVTFDDGYTDVLYTAKPLLEAMEVPATTFITTGNLGSKREFWWDELERLLLCPGTLPATLEVAIGKQLHRWELGAAADYSEAEALRNRTTRSYAASPGTRHALYHSVWQQLFPAPEEERQHVLAILTQWAGDPGLARAEFRSLHPDEVEALARDGLVEVGAHTVTHPALSAHAATTQLFEITESKRALEQILGRPVTSFAYPHGEYSRETLTLLRRAGVRRACTIRDGHITRRSDPLQLPRYNVQDWAAPEFEEHLSRWLGVVR